MLEKEKQRNKVCFDLSESRKKKKISLIKYPLSILKIKEIEQERKQELEKKLSE
jgi:hypothetical protein